MSTTTVPAAIKSLWTGWHADERQWLEDFHNAMRSEYQDSVKEMVLFGSKARGDWNDDSDIDVLVIVTEPAAALKDRIIEQSARLAAGSMAVPSVLAQTEREWSRLGRAEANRHAEVERQGVRLI